MRVLSNAHGLSQFAGPGAWNDLDMLQVGGAEAVGRTVGGLPVLLQWC